MYNETAEIMMLNTLTSTHPGSGTELSFVDLPIQREGHTGHPKIESSTLKGCMRFAVSTNYKNDADKMNRIFGVPDKGDFASAVSITDGRILFFPVKSVKGVFGWITCPMVIKRFFQDFQLAKNKAFMEDIPTEEGLVANECNLVHKMDRKDYIMLEDYTCQVKQDNTFDVFLDRISGYLSEDSLTKNMLKEHGVLVSDDNFTSFVKHSTEVNTRIKINPDTGTVAGTALFSEEFLPPECVFYSLVFFTQSRLPQEEGSSMVSCDKGQIKSEFLELFADRVIQIGANSTLGKGLVQVKIGEGK